MRIVDLALTLGAAARLSRLVITDEIGRWWVKDPIDRAMDRYVEREVQASAQEGRQVREPRWWKYRAGLDCPFCVGFWLGIGVLVSRIVLPSKVWRFGASALTLNYVAAHLGSHLGDFDADEESR